MSLRLVIGTKRWSSWSLRPWIALKQFGITFEEIVIPLRRDDTKSRILAYSPSGKVPVLIDGENTVWDSLAILDYLADRFPERDWWPRNLAARALARAIAAEMHAGFPAVRNALSMDVLSRLPTPQLTSDVQAEIARIQALWVDARTRFGASGPFLFGGFTNADAMYAPVATRFRTYGIPLDPVSQCYVDSVLGIPAFAEWHDGAAQRD